MQLIHHVGDGTVLPAVDELNAATFNDILYGEEA